ncbi:MAG TPA: hypothetical protein VN783_16075 [Thermoanaerobaculia bacterium]|nr:hypothetical protein [Thermoanaerobaculia bacterium]
MGQESALRVQEVLVVSKEEVKGDLRFLVNALAEIFLQSAESCEPLVRGPIRVRTPKEGVADRNDSHAGREAVYEPVELVLFAGNFL